MCAERRAASESETAFNRPTDENLRTPAESEPRLRAVERPQPASSASAVSLRGAEPPHKQLRSGVKRTVAALRAALPFVERILPLLESVTGTEASSLPAPQETASAALPTDLAGIEGSLAKLKTQHRELRDQVVEQNVSLKRVEDHLGLVREATDRNTREQQELIEELTGVGTKVSFLAVVALGLLMLSVVINIALCLRVR